LFRIKLDFQFSQYLYLSKKRNLNCPLCHTALNKVLHQDYLICDTCSGIVKDESRLLSSEDEKNRYLKHENDVNDLGYQNFTAPITHAVLRDFNKDNIGLDFGAGPSSVISKILRDHNYTILEYDPFFQPDKNLLNQKYDYIVCCEVMEHFYKPAEEFSLLKSRLKPNGKLYCMTHLYDSTINFEKWYYRNDATHVFIYQADTIQFIHKELGFSNVEIDKRLITFSA
jgi:SAM-dependent methyltransferase